MPPRNAGYARSWLDAQRLGEAGTDGGTEGQAGEHVPRYNKPDLVARRWARLD